MELVSSPLLKGDLLGFALELLDPPKPWLERPPLEKNLLGISKTELPSEPSKSEATSIIE